MPTKKRTQNYQVRLDKRSVQLVNMFKGELELNTAKTFSVAEAVNMLFDTCRPDLVEKLNKIAQSEEQ